MIDIDIWLPQIIGYCKFVLDDVGLRRAWIDGIYFATSITDFDELYEQVFDDLDSANYQAIVRERLPNNNKLTLAIASFLKSLQDVDRARSHNPELLDSALLLDANQWQKVRSAATVALDLYNKKPI